MCRICGLAHFGFSRTCPNLSSEVQIRLMLDALENSSEPRMVVDQLRKILRKELAGRAGSRKNQGYL